MKMRVRRYVRFFMHVCFLWLMGRLSWRWFSVCVCVVFMFSWVGDGWRKISFVSVKLTTKCFLFRGHAKRLLKTSTRLALEADWGRMLSRSGSCFVALHKKVEAPRKLLPLQRFLLKLRTVC